MKKLIIIFILALTTTFTFAQSTWTVPQNLGGPKTIVDVPGGLRLPNGLILSRFADTTVLNLISAKLYEGSLANVAGELHLRVNNKWIKISSSTIPGGIISSLPTIGFNPGSNISVAQWITNVFYASQVPLASLSGGGVFEFTSSSSVLRNLTWTASRQSATQPLSTIVVAGVNQAFSQPAFGGSVGNSFNTSITTNTTTVLNNLVTTTDGKTATASTTFSYSHKYYKGYVLVNNPNDAQIIATNGIFASNYNTSGTLSDPVSQSFIIFAFPASFGIPIIKINGLAVGFNLTTRSFINASGFSTSYNIFTSPFPTNSGVEYQIL